MSIVSVCLVRKKKIQKEITLLDAGAPPAVRLAALAFFPLTHHPSLLWHSTLTLTTLLSPLRAFPRESPSATASN